MNQHRHRLGTNAIRHRVKRLYRSGAGFVVVLAALTLVACSGAPTTAGVAAPNASSGTTAASAADPVALVAAVAAPGNTSSATAQQGEGNGQALGRAQQNVRVIQRFYDAYGRSDRDALRNELFAANIVWRIPGHHSLSGNHQGVEQVLAFFDQLASAGFRAEPITLAASDEWVIDLHRGWNTQGPARIDIVWALAFRIENDRIVEAINFPMDQHAADAFYLAQYPLKPLPDRLAR